MSLSLSVIIHPSLLPRLILALLFTLIGTLLSLVPLPFIPTTVSLRHIALRIATASLGSFGIILAIALLARETAWANVWERFWVHDGSRWGTKAEKGISAGYCLLLILGTVCDWFLHSRFGTNPDEKWDRYLATYASNLPNDASRQGTFTPFTSWWDRVTRKHAAFEPIVKEKDIIFSPPSEHDFDVKAPLTPISTSGPKLTKIQSHARISEGDDLFTAEAIVKKKGKPGFLRKKSAVRVPGVKKHREAIKFMPLDEETVYSSSESESELKEDGEGQVRDKNGRVAWNRTDSEATLTHSRHTNLNSKGSTLTDRHSGLAPPSAPALTSRAPEYSDREEDITNLGLRDRVREKLRKKDSGDGDKWEPGFIRRHSIKSQPQAAYFPSPAGPRSTRPPRSQTLPVTFPTSTTPPIPTLTNEGRIMQMPIPVPATPSLIRAVERVRTAQEEVFRSISVSGSTPVPSSQPQTPTTPSGIAVVPAQDGVQGNGEKKPRRKSWDAFWEEVKAKAEIPPNPHVNQGMNQTPSPRGQYDSPRP